MAKNTQFRSNHSGMWLPSAALEAKRWISFAKTSLFAAFPILILLGAYTALKYSVAAGIILLIFSVISILMILFNDRMIIAHLNSGKFALAGRNIKIFGILGLFCVIFPGILYIISYIRLRDIFKPQSQRYPSGYNESIKSYISSNEAPQERAVPKEE